MKGPLPLPAKRGEGRGEGASDWCACCGSAPHPACRPPSPLGDRAAFMVIVHKVLCNNFAGRVGQAAAKPRRPTIRRASIGGPALAFARWSTFRRFTSLYTHCFKAARSPLRGRRDFEKRCENTTKNASQRWGSSRLQDCVDWSAVVEIQSFAAGDLQTSRIQS